MNLIKQHPFSAFVVITFAISWIIWSSLLVFEQPIMLVLPVIILGAFGPLLSAVIVTLVTDGRDGLRKWRKQIFKFHIGAKFYILALIYPIIFITLSYGLYLVMGGEPIDFTNVPPWYGYPILVFVFFIGAGQEEPGWRGFALPRLLSKYSPFISSIILGFIWTIWHIPLFFIEGSSQVELPFEYYLPNVIAMAIVLTLLYLKSSGSVLPAMVLHAGLNSVLTWFPMESGILPSWAYLTIVGWIIVILLMLIFGRTSFFCSPHNVEKNSKGEL